MGLILPLFDVTSARDVPLAYRSTCNIFFMDIPVSSFVFHLSLLAVKSVNLVVSYNGFLCMSVVSTLITEMLFEYFLIFTAV